MNKFWKILYNAVVIPTLVLFFRTFSVFNKKIERGIKDRKKLFENLIISLADIDKSKKMIWFHSSSMGEFEQAKPIIKKLKLESDVNIAITFFSPSGYRNSLKYPYADIINYIPLDTPKLANRFLSLLNPKLAVFMRYDIWPNFMWGLNKRKIPTLLVDATMNKNSKRKLPGVKNFHKCLFNKVTKILTVSEEDKNQFKSFGLADQKLEAVGDTRFDRVYQKSVQAKERKLFDSSILKDKKIFVFGSSWEADEEVVFPAFMKLAEKDEAVVMIIAPHEPTELHLEKLEHYFAKTYKTIRFSEIRNYKGERVIIVDSIGILLSLYYYAHVAFVGGSFKQGIHNVLEPSVYGIPVIFGPKYSNSQEAEQLVKLGGAVSIKDKKGVYRYLRTYFSDEIKRKHSGSVSYNYVNKNIGATEKILQHIYKYI